MTDITQEYLSPRAAGDYCGVNRTTITSWIKERGLKARRMPSGYFRIKKIDLDKFLAKFDDFREWGPGKALPVVLVVDDEEVIRSTIDLALRDEYKVLQAINSTECMQLIDECKPDVILLDVILPGNDGYEICRILREDRDTCGIPIIFISGKTEEESVVKGLELGAEDYLRKPFGSLELQARIETVLKRK